MQRPQKQLPPGWGSAAWSSWRWATTCCDAGRFVGRRPQRLAPVASASSASTRTDLRHCFWSGQVSLKRCVPAAAPASSAAAPRSPCPLPGDLVRIGDGACCYRGAEAHGEEEAHGAAAGPRLLGLPLALPGDGVPWCAVRRHGLGQRPHADPCTPGHGVYAPRPSRAGSGQGCDRPSLRSVVGRLQRRWWRCPLRRRRKSSLQPRLQGSMPLLPADTSTCR